MSRHWGRLRGFALDAKKRALVPGYAESKGSPPPRGGQALVLVKCEVRNLNAKGTSIAVWLGEYDGEREVWQWLPNMCVTATEGGVLIPQWLATKEGLL